jgi:hypothetical protein
MLRLLNGLSIAPSPRFPAAEHDEPVPAFLQRVGLKVISTVPVAWRDWDADAEFYAVEDQGGRRYLVVTDVGRPYALEVADAREVLKEKLKLYEQVTAATRQALDLFEKP